MTITFDESYYRGSFVANPNPAGYDNYNENTYFDENFASLASKFIAKFGSIGVALAGKKVLVVGCAYGYLVQELVNLGVDAYGMDISTFAISQAPSSISSRVMVGDVRVAADLTAVKIFAGLTGNNKFALIIDEDMLCCLTDAEATAFCVAARKICSYLCHLVTIGAHLITWYNYHTITEWKSILDTANKDKWYARFTWSET